MYKIVRGNYKSSLSYNGLSVPTFVENLLASHFSVVHFENSKGRGPAHRVVTQLYEDGLMYSGIVVFVKRFLKRLGYNCKIINDNTYFVPNANKGARRINKKLHACLRDYQSGAVAKNIGKSLTLTSLPTGTGKTVIIAAMLLSDNCKTLVVVDSQILMRQLADSIEFLTGVECGQVGGGVFIPRKWTVAIIDSLLTSRGQSLVQSVKAIYFDEVHKSASNSYKRIVDLGHKNLLIRRGFSGTTYRNDHRTLLLPALSGPITMHKSTSEMIDAGWLAIPHISMPKITKPGRHNLNKKWYHKLVELCIMANHHRNHIGCELLAHSAKQHKLSIGLFRGVAKHLPRLKKEIYRYLPKEAVGIIHGSVPLDKRRRILEGFANGDYLVLLASCGTVGEGIDLPGETKLGVNFVGGCSEVLVRQMLGRVLRKPKKGHDINRDVPYHIHYIDPYDQTHEEMERQARVRYDIYNSEEAFDVETM